MADLVPDRQNFDALNDQQKAAVIRMASHAFNRQMFWDEDEDFIVPEAIRFRQMMNMHVFPHIEFMLEDAPVSPPRAPGTPPRTE